MALRIGLFLLLLSFISFRQSFLIINGTKDRGLCEVFQMMRRIERTKRTSYIPPILEHRTTARTVCLKGWYVSYATIPAPANTTTVVGHAIQGLTLDRIESRAELLDDWPLQAPMLGSLRGSLFVELVPDTEGRYTGNERHLRPSEFMSSNSREFAWKLSRKFILPCGSVSESTVGDHVIPYTVPR